MENSMGFKLRKKSKRELTEKSQKLYTRGTKIAKAKGQKAYDKTLKKEEEFFAKHQDYDYKKAGTLSYEKEHGHYDRNQPGSVRNIDSEFIKKRADEARFEAEQKAYKKNLRIKLLTKRGKSIDKKKRKRD